MARKKDDDRVLIEYEYTVYSCVLAEAVLKLTEAWNTFREFEECPNRELTERELIHFKSALFITKDIHQVISIVAQEYNMKNAKAKNKVVPFKTGGLPDGTT